MEGAVPNLGRPQFFLYAHVGPFPGLTGLVGCAGFLDYGAIFESHCFSSAWSIAQSSLSIAYKEAAYVWGPQWVSRKVEFLRDNESIIWLWWPSVIHFYLQLHQSKVKLIQLLMHSLDSNFSNSDAWSHMPCALPDPLVNYLRLQPLLLETM